jgi:alpha-tubulin suppressor-like RCC1 family protein
VFYPPRKIVAWLAMVILVLAAAKTYAQAQGLASGTPARHALLVCQDGTVQGWGSNYDGELCNFPFQTPTPTTITGVGLTAIKKVTVGYNCSYAIKQDGTLLAWGNNDWGKLGTGSTVGATSLPAPVVFPAGIAIVDVAVGFRFAVALASDGSVWTWGRQGYGQLGTGNSSAGANTYRNMPAQIPVSAFSSYVTAIDAGSEFALALCADGKVYSWGNNGNGAIGQGAAVPIGVNVYTPGVITFPVLYPGAASPVITKISTGLEQGMALSNDYKLFTWGYNLHGSIGDNSTTTRNSPVRIDAAQGAIGVASTEYASCAVFADGHTLMWGNNDNGYLGTCFGQAQVNYPIAGPTFTPGVRIKSSGLMFTSIETSGQLQTWGHHPLGYTPTYPSISPDGSCQPQAPVGACAALPCAPVAIIASRSSICLGSKVTLTASGGEGVPYTWSPMTGVISSTANSITVSPSATTTYTAASSCGAPASFQVVVNNNCCVKKEITNLIPLAGTYTSYAFATGGYYSIPDNQTVTLTSGTYSLVNATLLMGQDAHLVIDSGAQLYLYGSTITAACDLMWADVRVTSTGGGIYTAAYGNQRSRIMQSINGVIFDNANTQYPPYFRFRQTDFQQNIQSMSVNRAQGAANSADCITDCTFDSDPAKFLAPYKQTSATSYYYAAKHMTLTGNVQMANISLNSFKRAYFGVYIADSPQAINLADLRNNTFADFWLGGVFGAFDQSSSNANSVLNLANNTFTFPTATKLPATTQTASVQASYSNGAPAETFGAYLLNGDIRAHQNTFRQLDSLVTVNMKDYGTFAQDRPRQTGLFASRMSAVTDNRFYLLDIGIDIRNVPAGALTEMQGNGIANCRLGIQAATYQYDLTNPPQLYASCNTFRRDAQRAGTSTGIALNLPSTNIGSTSAPVTVWPRIIVRDFRSTTSNVYPVRNLFQDGGVNATVTTKKFVALSNNSSAGTGQYTLDYRTFDNYVFSYAPWTSANVSVGGAGININPNATAGAREAPCQADNYPASGIQQRGAGSGAIVTPGVRPQLGQNSPNPFSGSTTVYYQLPVGTADAQLLLRRSTDGRPVQQVVLDVANNEQKINLQGYEPGVYFGTLLVGGTAVHTIRMLIK